MTIAVNGYEAVISRFGHDKKGLPARVGSSLYCFELLSNLNRIDSKNNYRIYIPPFTGSDPEKLGLPPESDRWKYAHVKKRFGPWTATSLSWKLHQDKKDIDVFFTPTHYLPPLAPKNSVISILDVSYLYFPQLFRKKDLVQLKYWTRFSARKSSLIFTISQSSKNDIIKEYKLPRERVVVTHLGIKPDTSKNTVSDIKKKYGIDSDYILFVGTIQPRKNIKRLIEAFSRIPQKNIKLLIVGKKGWQYEEILEAPGQFGIGDRVKFLDFVPDEDLALLYKNALCFVLPSLYEGFGLPILEAMKHGCPVITSNVSSMPEVSGDGALLVDPENVSDIAKKIEELVSDEGLRSDLIKKGHTQVKKFSWENTAKQTLKALESLAQS